MTPYNVSQEENNVIRKRLTDATYAKFANKKGDGLWETSSKTAYHGQYTSGTANTWSWLVDTKRSSTQGAQTVTGWNSDFMEMGHAYRTWFSRGGFSENGLYTGLFATLVNFGNPYPSYSFRPVLVQGIAL